METSASSSLLSFHRPFPLHLPSQSFNSLSLPFPTRRARSYLISKAELPDSSNGSSTSSDTSKPPGFGSAAEPTKKKNKAKGRDRAAIIRRSPVERPSPSYSATKEEGQASQEQPSVNESAFLLTWAGLGLLILVEGIALAASGFLPEKWDNLFVKYLYPSFTPTVFLFVAGTTTYGVLKYLQGEKMKR